MKLKRRVAALIALITISICALLVVAILKAHNEALAQARLKASYLSEALAEDMAGAINVVACVSEVLKASIAKDGKIWDLSDLKQQIQKYAPGLTDISIIGADGKMVATTVTGASEGIDFSDRDYFRAHRDDDKISFRIGKPITARPSGRTIVPLTRRLLTEQGAFAGVAVFIFDPEVFASAYQRVDPGNTGSLELVGTDGVIRAGFTLAEGQRKSMVEPLAVTEKALLAAQSSTAGDVGEGSRIYSWRKLDSFPLIAVVGLGQAEAMGGAYRQAIFLFGLGILSVGLLLNMEAMLARELSRRANQARALERQTKCLEEANAKLAIAKRQAEEASQSKSIFLANISHEFRTPLNAILGFAEIIRDQIFGDDPGRYAGYASDIYRSGYHLLNLVTGLLDLTKIEAGKFELHEAWANLDELIAESFRVVSDQAESRGVQLTQPATASGVSLYADETAVKQILINLLSNAVKFSAAGGRVSLSALIEADGSLALVIRDTGIGMTSDEIRQAMQPFQRVRNEPRQLSEGTGLGLPLAAQLTELHGGSLTIESTPGAGTVVTVRFPAARVEAIGDRPDPN